MDWLYIYIYIYICNCIYNCGCLATFTLSIEDWINNSRLAWFQDDFEDDIDYQTVRQRKRPASSKGKSAEKPKKGEFS